MNIEILYTTLKHSHDAPPLPRQQPLGPSNAPKPARSRRRENRNHATGRDIRRPWLFHPRGFGPRLQNVTLLNQDGRKVLHLPRSLNPFLFPPMRTSTFVPLAREANNCHRRRTHTSHEFHISINVTFSSKKIAHWFPTREPGASCHNIPSGEGRGFITFPSIIVPKYLTKHSCPTNQIIHVYISKNTSICRVTVNFI